MKIGFIGAGKVGCSLGKYFSIHGHTISGYASFHKESAIEAAQFTNSVAYNSNQDVVNNSSIIFFTVPDDRIEALWNSMNPYDFKDKILCHCSGSLSSTIFSEIERFGGWAYSIHPLFAINDKWNSYLQLSNAYFTIEGSKGRLAFMMDFLTQLGNSVQQISSKNKWKYHTAASMVSNHMIALAQIGMELLAECGFDKESAQNALSPLMLFNVQNICREGTVNALTGPIERNDMTTIEKHLDNLNKEQLKIYCSLANVLISIGKEKHPGRDYHLLEELISHHSTNIL